MEKRIGGSAMGRVGVMAFSVPIVLVLVVVFPFN
jgi:hypothetical protein